MAVVVERGPEKAGEAGGLSTKSGGIALMESRLKRKACIAARSSKLQKSPGDFGSVGDKGLESGVASTTAWLDECDARASAVPTNDRAQTRLYGLDCRTKGSEIERERRKREGVRGEK